MLNKMLLLLLGGGLGTIGRFYLAAWGQERWGTHLPYGTLLVNLTGCCMLGGLLAVFESRFGSLDAAPYALRLLLISGFLGGLTTFSSYELETLLLLRHGSWERALLYAVGSVALGLFLMLGSFRLSRLVLLGRF